MGDRRVALITGGSDGIGFGIARALAVAGIEDIILVARTQSKLDDAKQAIEAATSTRVATYSIDLTSGEESDWDQLHRFVQEHYGKLDYLVNNAGEFDQMKGELTPGEYMQRKRKSQLLNAVAPDILSAMFRGLLLAGKERKILDMGSQAVIGVFEDNTTYASSKEDHMRMSIQTVYDTKGAIRTYRLYPGLVDTKAVAHIEAPKLAIEEVGQAAAEMLLQDKYTDLFIRREAQGIVTEGCRFDYDCYKRPDGSYNGTALLDDYKRAMALTFMPALRKLTGE